jgi:NAD(P)-dependent dehydrogenase (short-subunit alcohol dehydrogenase family)
MVGQRLAGKTALVLGGTSGIGEEIVRRFAREGARVALGGRRAERGQHIADELKRGGHEAMFVAVDAAHHEQVKRFCEEVTENYGQLDIAVNAQGWNELHLLRDLDCEKWDEIVHVCLNTMFYAIKYECEQMLRGQGGVIINISSINSVVANNYQGAYCAAKAGVDMLSKVAAIEYGPDKIRINVINPGLTRTELAGCVFDNKRAYSAFMQKTPLRTYAEPSDIADAAVFLASDEARFISGAALFVDGGITHEGYPDAFRIVKDDEERYK